MKYDFGGYATRNDLTCSDGRVIKKDAFKAQNGQTVPLVWNHNHNDVNDVLGLAHLEIVKMVYMRIVSLMIQITVRLQKNLYSMAM